MWILHKMIVDLYTWQEDTITEETYKYSSDKECKEAFESYLHHFDCRMLSEHSAEIYEDSQKIYIEMYEDI